MGFVKKKTEPTLQRLPTGSFTVDAQGEIVSSTVPQAVPTALVREIGQQVVAILKGAREARLAFSELVVQYSAFKITARDMRGGAVIFLAPKALQPVAQP